MPPEHAGVLFGSWRPRRTCLLSLCMMAMICYPWSSVPRRAPVVFACVALVLGPLRSALAAYCPGAVCHALPVELGLQPRIPRCFLRAADLCRGTSGRSLWLGLASSCLARRSFLPQGRFSGSKMARAALCAARSRTLRTSLSCPSTISGIDDDAPHHRRVLLQVASRRRHALQAKTLFDALLPLEARRSRMLGRAGRGG